MKANIKLIKRLFISIIFLANVAQANCTGGHCTVSLDFLNTKTTTVKKVNHKTFTKFAQLEDKSSDEATTTRPIKVYVASNEFHESSVAVQVGSLRSYREAKSFAKRYKLIGDQFRTVIVKATVANKVYYRVHVKGFESRDEANMFAASYSNIGAFLVSL